MKKTSTFQNALIWFGAGVSLAEILTGTAFAPLGMGKGLLAILIGHVIGCGLMLLAGALIAEFGDPTLQTRVRSRIGNDIRTEFRILVRDFRQEHGIGVRILHGRHRGIEIDHHDLLVSWSVTILLNGS